MVPRVFLWVRVSLSRSFFVRCIPWEVNSLCLAMSANIFILSLFLPDYLAAHKLGALNILLHGLPADIAANGKSAKSLMDGPIGVFYLSVIKSCSGLKVCINSDVGILFPTSPPTISMHWAWPRVQETAPCPGRAWVRWGRNGHLLYNKEKVQTAQSCSKDLIERLV